MLDYKVLVHYHNPTGDYFSYDMWQWQINHWGKEAAFSKLDYFGIQGELSFQTWEPLDHAHVIIKRSDWSSQSCDYHIDLLPPHLVTEIWLIEEICRFIILCRLQRRVTSIHVGVRITLIWP